ncbi:MAG: hypothetical protein LBR75_03325 [Prevotellaceae bacterium]|jgi:hypothetical protein|nr:hypothetical protein [Prevotellaceae bacterium]
MKKILLTVFALTSIMLTNAQTKNIDLDLLRFPVAYRSIATQPLNPLFFTYSVFVNAPKPTEHRVSLAEIEDLTYIEGQFRVNNNENADVSIIVNLGNLVVQGSSVNERKEERKNKEGQVTGVSYYYSIVANYTFESNYKVVQGDKALITGVGTAPTTTLTYKSTEYGNRRDAVNFWDNNKDVLISEFATDLSRQMAAAATARASSLFGFPVVKTFDSLQTTDEKKHLENEPFRAKALLTKEKLEKITPDEKLAIDAGLEECIEYFKSIPQKYADAKLKADIRLRFAAYYNLCTIYYYLEDIENVRKYADLLVQNGHDAKDDEKFKKEADKLQETFKRTFIKTRHFNPENYF